MWYSTLSCLKQQQAMETKQSNSNKRERWVYIGIIIVVALYGLFKDSEVATTMMGAIKDAFSILLIN